MRRLLIVSPHFPPLNAPDMQRIRMSLPYYRACGWEPVVLAVRDDRQVGVREPGLLATIPPEVTVLRANAVAPRLARWLGVGNIGLRAWFGLWRAGSRYLRRHPCDLVFFSTTQFFTFTLGPLWRRRFGVPYVLDFQDPWLTDFYERPGAPRPPGGWKYRFAHAQARLLEGACVRRAAGLISVSPSYIADLAARYPSVRALPSAVLTFGASPEDLALARSLPGGNPWDRGGGQVHIVYTGAAGPVMPQALAVLFAALRRYRDRFPARAARLRLHFVGTSYAAPGAGTLSVLPIARAWGVADLAAETPHRIGYLEAARLQQAADALLLLGSSDPAYSPSKVYLYFLSGRPMLALVFRGSVMERLLDELNCATLIRLQPGGTADAPPPELEAFFDAALDGFPPASLPERREAHFRARYLAGELTRRQCELFDAALR